MKLLTRIKRLSAPVLLAMALAIPAAAQNYCNNPVPPCSTDDPASPCYRPPDPPPKCEPRKCGKCTKSPCYAGSGVYAAEGHDLEITTTGFPIDVSRLYQSSHRIDGESGYGWTSSLSTRLYYAVYLKSAPDTYQREADVRLPDGILYRFVDNGDGTFTPPQGRFDTLSRNPDGTFELWLQYSRSRYLFAANGSLTSMVDEFGNTQTWTYVSDRLHRIEDSSGSGRYIDITYGADGRISDVTDMTGRNVHYAYDSRGVLVGVTNPAGQTVHYDYVNGKYVPLLNTVRDHWNRNVTTIVFDAQDRVRSYTEAGETYTYTYAYNGVSTTTAKSDSSGNIFQYPFTFDGLVTDTRNPGGDIADHVDYYDNGLIKLYKDATGVKTFYTYNARGNPLTVIYDYQGPTAVEWRYTYDATYPEKVSTSLAYDPATGLIHPHWQGQKQDYYPAGSPAPGAVYHVYRFDSNGTTTRLIQTLTYDTHGRVLTTTDAAGNVTTNTYDTDGNLATVTLPANNDAGTQPVTSYAYDALGRNTSVTDADGRLVTYAWDVLNRVTSTTLPKPAPSSTINYTTTYFYDEYDSASGLLFDRAVDANGRVLREGTDQYGQVIQRIDPAGSITRNAYTKGLLASQTDPNGNVTTYAWDAFRRLSTTTYADGTFDRYTYYGDDRVATKRDRKNQTITYTYDRHKRLATKGYPNGGAITYTYQGQKLTQVSDTFSSPAETHAMTYDASFRPTGNTQASRGSVSYTYTADDRLLTVTVAGRATTTYAYYPDGSIRNITWSPVTGNFHFDYGLTGALNAITYPNGQTRSYTRDDQGRLVRVANVHPTAGTLAQFDLNYDVDPFTGLVNQIGNRTSVTATVPALGLTGATTNFGFDSRNFLNRVAYPSAAPYNGATSQWTYDAIGNRTSATENGTTTSYMYFKFGTNPLNNSRLQSDGGNTYAYDANGNVTARSGSRGNFTFSFDYENRLRSTNGDTTAGYLYDYLGRRSLKTEGGVQTTFVYEQDQPIAESGAATADYLFGSSTDQALAVQRNGQVYYYDVDPLESVVAVNDAAGAVQNSYAWDAWGIARAANETLSNSILYTGRESAQAGLLYYRYRFYEPATGRFASEDPLGTDKAGEREISLPMFEEMQSVAVNSLQNLQAYANDNPIHFVDPWGLAGCTPAQVKVCQKGCWQTGGNYADCFIERIPCLLFDIEMTVCKCQKKNQCTRPCPHTPPKPTEIHHTPNQHGCKNGHWHYWKWNQNPTTCQCYPQRLLGGCL